MSSAAGELARKEGASELRLPLVTARKLEELYFEQFGFPELAAPQPQNSGPRGD